MSAVAFCVVQMRQPHRLSTLAYDWLTTENAFTYLHLSALHQLTLHAIRSTRDRIRIGMSETKVSHLLDQEFVKLGIDHHGSAEGLILFGGKLF